jgi:DNA-binding beta-propeller fold protein YncE
MLKAGSKKEKKMKNFIQKKPKSVTSLVLICFAFFLFLSTSTGVLHSQNQQNTKKTANMIEKEIPKSKVKQKRSIWPFIIGGVAFAALVVFLLLKKSGNDENQGPVTTTKWGGKGSGQGKFSHIVDVCIDKNGYVYVSDPGNNRVQIFTQDGTFVKQWNTSIGAMTIYNDTLYAGCSGGGLGGGICIFDLKGRLKKSWIIPDPDKSDMQYCGASAIAVDKKGNVYVTEPGYHRVLKYTGNGFLLQTWTHGPGGRQDRLNSPRGIVIKNNEVYVSDTMNYRIIVFHLEGTPTRSWTFHDTETRPGDMALWGDSYLLVTSIGYVEVGRLLFGTVSKYSLDGIFLGTTPHRGLTPTGIAVNFKKQKIYVATYYQYIAVLDPF